MSKVTAGGRACREQLLQFKGCVPISTLERPEKIDLRAFNPPHVSDISDCPFKFWWIVESGWTLGSLKNARANVKLIEKVLFLLTECWDRSPPSCNSSRLALATHLDKPIIQTVRSGERRFNLCCYRSISGANGYPLGGLGPCVPEQETDGKQNQDFYVSMCRFDPAHFPQVFSFTGWPVWVRVSFFVLIFLLLLFCFFHMLISA